MITEQLNQAVDKFYADKIRISPARSNNCSQLAWPIRHLVLRRVAWEYAKPHTTATQRRFERGIELEKYFLNHVIPELPGITIFNRALSVEYKEFELAGRIDAEILIKDEGIYPLEIKSLQYMNRYTTPESFKTNSLFTANYYHQLNLYLLCKERPKGLFLLIDPISFATRWLEMPLDYEEAGKILEKCQQINTLVHKWDKKIFNPEDVQSLPDCEECSTYCQFQALCGLVDAPVDMTDLDLDRVDYLAGRKLELEEEAKEYEDIKDELKKITMGHPTIITPRFLVEGAYQKGPTTYEMPKEIKEQYKKDGENYWRVKKIINLG